MFWYWSLVALLLAIFLICAVGLLARNYFGKRIIEWVDGALLRIPLLNKVYGTMKQVNDAFSSSNKTSFRTVVLVEYPRPGIHSVGFITGEQQGEAQAKLREKVVCVFIPTTPNPTSGFLMLVPEDKVIKLEMSVADGIKYIISLGSIIPEYSPLGRRRPRESSDRLLNNPFEKVLSPAILPSELPPGSALTADGKPMEAADAVLKASAPVVVDHD